MYQHLLLTPLRLFSHDFQAHNTDETGAPIPVVPLTVELRPEDDASKTYTSFMLPTDQVCTLWSGTASVCILGLSRLIWTPLKFIPEGTDLSMNA